MDRHQYAPDRRNTFAALESKEHRPQMSQKSGQRNRTEHLGLQVVSPLQHLCQSQCQPSLTRIAGQGQGCSRVSSGPQHIGCSRIAGSIFARIGQSEQFADNHGKRQRADQIAPHHHDDFNHDLKT